MNFTRTTAPVSHSRRARLLAIASALCLAAFEPVPAQDIVVRKGAGTRATIEWTGFATQGTGQTVAEVAQADLNRSGWFRVVPTPGAEYRVVGEARDDGGALRAQCTVYETASGRAVLRRTYSGTPAQVRAVAHRMADDIVEAVTGRKGFASAKLVVVGNRTGFKELYVCDSDGHNLIQLTHDRSISLYPRWGGRNEYITYTAYLRNNPAAYRIHVATGQRDLLAGFAGLNMSPVLSPDGRSCALVMSREGNPELYVQTPPGGAATRITRTLQAAEATPTWSPDGSQICFVSDLAGRPQLFVVSRQGGAPRRLTTRGVENVSPNWGPDGRIVYATRVGSQYRLCVLDPTTGQTTPVGPEDASYEDPSWAPNARHVACTRVAGYRASICLIDTVTGETVTLVSGSGDWYAPDWTR